MLALRVFLFVLVVAGIAAFVYWLVSAKTRKAAAYVNHKHEMDEIKTDKQVKQWKKTEEKEKKK